MLVASCSYLRRARSRFVHLASDGLNKEQGSTPRKIIGRAETEVHGGG